MLLLLSPCPTRLCRREFRQHRFAGNGGLSLMDQRPGAVRKVHIDPGAKTDHADALAGADCVTLAHERNDATRHQTGNLDHDERHAGRGPDDEGVTLVRFACLVEIGADEGAGRVDHALDASADRTAIHVAIEYAHENGDADERPLAEFKLLRWCRTGDTADTAVRRRHYDTFARRRHPRRIAEEIDAPERRHGGEPTERRPQPEQDDARQRKATDEGIALRMDRRQLRADGVDDRHCGSLGQPYSAASAAG